MNVYKENYLYLFNRLTDLLQELGQLKTSIIAAQQAAEERVLSAQED